jgi:hypothetical protein
MNLDIYATYEEANTALELPRDVGVYGDLIPIPALSQREHAEQYSCVVHVRKWSYEGNKEPPDLTFIGLECVAHIHNGYKTDIFIYARCDRNDSQR